VSFLGKIVAALQVSRGDGRFGLIHELFYLIYQLLLICGELAPRDLLQILFRGGAELFGGTLLRCLLRRCASDQLYRGLL